MLWISGNSGGGEQQPTVRFRRSPESLANVARRSFKGPAGACLGMLAATAALAVTVEWVSAGERDCDVVARAPVTTFTQLDCLTDEDCDDGDGCTIDRCVDTYCAYEPIPDCVSCTIEIACPPIDLVFLMDTSGSMRDEAAVLCSRMADVVASLGAQGIIVNPTFLGITEAPGGAFSCPTDDVVSLLGGAVPGNAASCSFPGELSSHESWGPATAIVAERFPWNAQALRVIVPMSDEGPCNGSFVDGCNNPGDDRDSVTNAATVAHAHSVIVSPITGTGSDDCVLALASYLAAITGGQAFQSQDPDADLTASIEAVVRAACETKDDCDDGDPCTVNDTCDETGRCQGTPIETIPCTTDADCFGLTCDPNTNMCVCSDRPDLCLEVVTPTLPGGDCYDSTGELVVQIVLGHSLHVIAGGQFLIRYDPAVLDFLSVEPGAVGDPASPFILVLAEIVDEEKGEFFYAVGASFEELGTQGPAVMATLRFRPLASCASDELCFFDDNPRNTILADITGHRVEFVPGCCTGNITFAGEPPILTCPENVQANADAGGFSAVVTWDPLEVIPSCDTPPDVVCTAAHSHGMSIDGLIEAGGEFPIGTAQFECNAVDPVCGEVSTCVWNVAVHNTSLVEVDVELSSPIADAPLDRCIEFEFFRSCIEPPEVHEATLRFGPPYNFPGNVHRAQLKIPAANYDCATARDPLHTLRSVSEVEIIGTAFTATFVGDPLLGNGNWLVSGNLDGNHVIDILDLGIVLSKLGSLDDPNTPCGTSSPHADLNGDGIVDEYDVDVVDRHLQEQDKEGCCPTVRAADAIMEISIKDLRARSLGNLNAADLNRDGWLNLDDLTAFRQGVYIHEVKRSLDRLHR